MQELLSVDQQGWLGEVDQINEYLDTYGDRLPASMRDELHRIKQELA